MAEHVIQVDYIDQNRYTNDPRFHDDEEYQLLRLLQMWWNTENTNQIKPMFYLTEKDIAHDLSLAPAIVIYNSVTESEPVGIGYPAKKNKKTMMVEIKSLDRPMLYDTKNEAIRILYFCRKRPFEGWDYLMATVDKRQEPRSGNYHFVIQVELMRLVEPIPEASWT